MKIFPTENSRSSCTKALTLVELLVVIAVVVILFGMFVPIDAHTTKARAVRIKCASNLKQVGLAFRTWKDAHGDYPMSYFTNAAGETLYPDAAHGLHYFQVMSNELNDPRILACPADMKRYAATNFTTDFNSSHISYFLGLDADESRPYSILAGDSHITNGMEPKGDLLELTTNQPVGWTMERHDRIGNVLLSDGSVQQFSTTALRAALQQTGLVTNRLLLPEAVPTR